jgi:hypothetical protein
MIAKVRCIMWTIPILVAAVCTARTDERDDRRRQKLASYIG